MKPRQVLIEYSFRNPDLNLGLEVVTVEQLRQRLSPTAREALHRADFHQLFVVRSGEVNAVVDFVEHSCTRGVVLQVRPGQVLRLPYRASAAVDAVAVLFTSVFPQPLPQVDDVLGSFGAAVYEVGAAEADALVTAVTELASTYDATLQSAPLSAGAAVLLRQMLGVILLRLSVSSTRTYNTEDIAAFETVRRFQSELERSFATTRAASDYATRIGYSARTLNRTCLAVTNHSAKELINARVLLEAKRLLAYTDVPTSTIARRLGFSEPTNFGKYFRRGAGESPGAFRRANQATITSRIALYTAAEAVLRA